MSVPATDFEVNAPINKIPLPTETLSSGPYTGGSYSADGGGIILVINPTYLDLGWRTPGRSVVEKFYIACGTGSSVLGRFVFVHTNETVEHAASNAQWLSEEFTLPNQVSDDEMLEVNADPLFNGLESLEGIGLYLTSGSIEDINSLTMYATRRPVLH
jgi:hypothetical protein